MLTLKTSAIKYKDADGAMQDLGAVVGTQTPDAALSDSSTNCVQNKVVYEKFTEAFSRISELEARVAELETLLVDGNGVEY